MNTRVIWVRVAPNDKKALQFSDDRTNWHTDQDFVTYADVNDTIIWQFTEFNPKGKIEKEINIKHKKSIFSEHVKLNNGSFIAVVKSDAKGKKFDYNLKAEVDGRKFNHDPMISINS